MNPEYLFLAQFVVEQKKVLDSISIALRKSRGNSLTASEIRNMNTSHLRNLIFSDQAYIFMKNIKGSPAYWQRFMYDVLAMIKQLGPPSWWMTFSCADLRWNEIYKILSKLQGKELTDQEIDLMTYNEKCKMLNSNPVVVVKHFQYRLETLFKEVLLGSGEPIGKILHDAIRIEFQFRGSAHAHCFVWVERCPLLTDENFNMLIEFIDRSISAVCQTKSSFMSYILLLRLTKHILIQRHARDTGMYHVASILVIFSQKRQSLQNHCLKNYTKT